MEKKIYKRMRWILWEENPILFSTKKELIKYTIDNNIKVYRYGKKSTR